MKYKPGMIIQLAMHGYPGNHLVSVSYLVDDQHHGALCYRMKDRQNTVFYIGSLGTLTKEDIIVSVIFMENDNYSFSK